MADNEEIVDLVLRADYLDSDELKKMSDDVEELGEEATKTEKKLDGLKIDRANIQSFNELSNEVKELGSDLDRSTAEYKKNSIELKKNKNATVEQVTAVEKQGRELKAQNKIYNTRSLELSKVSSALKKSGIETKNLTGLEKKYSAEIKLTQKELKNTKLVRDAEIVSLTKTYNAKKKVIDQQKIEAVETKKSASAKEKAADESVKALNKEIVAAKKLQVARDKKTASDKASVAETKRVTDAVNKYEIALTKLHDEYKKGDLSKSKYIKAESKLRRELNLTEKQVKDTNRAIAADVSTKKARSTDLLTTATRRLAQAYTVLLAAQKASQAITESVSEYSDLESAQIKVAKTTNLMRDQIVDMADEFTKLATEVTPTATNELLRYAEVAGQLGVEGTENILRMAAAADALNVSTDLAGDEAATLLTRILTMTKEGVPAINDLSSVVVELGNNTATTESEIVQMTKEIVTGTTAIGLGSTAAAALGATLKELGQTGERSRSAFTRLSATINDAVTDGGKDLELLQKITGQTADELEKNLGDRPELIIQDFVEGLGRLRDEGISTKNTLNEFGITAGESVQVFDALANNTERYARAVKLADAAQKDGTKHIQEAAKAYASQDASIKRLINKFIDLKASVGEAYSDEVYDSIEGLTKLLDENKEAVISFMESMLELGEGLKEVFEDLQELDSILGSLAGGVSLVGVAFNALKSGFNAIAITINYVIKNLVDLSIKLFEVKKSFGLLSEEGQKQLDGLRESSASLAASIDRDMQDIVNAGRDMQGESSDAYRDLIKNANQYEEAVSNLSEEQKTQLDLILESGKFNAELQGEYRDLTAAIIANKRELEILNKQKERLVEADKKTAEAAEKVAKVNKLVETSVLKVKTQFESYTKAVEKLDEALFNDTITIDQHTEALKELDKAQNDLLVSSGEIGVIYEDLSDTVEKTETSYEGMSSAAIELTGVIVDQEKELDDLRKVIESKTASDKKQAQAQRDLILVGRELKVNQFELAIQNELDTASSERLILVKQQLVKDLDTLNKIQASGTELTKIELIQKTALEAAIATLNERIGEHKDITEDDKDVIDDQVESVKELSEVLDGNTESINKNKKSAEELLNEQFAASASASAWTDQQLALQKQYDYTSESTEDLVKKFQELNSQMWMNVQSSQEWFGDLHDLTQAANRHKAATIEQTLVMRSLQEQVEEGSLSLEELERASDRAATGFNKLDDTQLVPLRTAIEAARREFEALDDSINDSFDRTQDRLDELLGKEADILARQFEREMQDAQALLDQARGSGDNELITRAQQNINNLKQAQSIELKQYKEDEAKAAADAKEAKAAAAKAEKEAAESLAEYEREDEIEAVERASTADTGDISVTNVSNVIRVELIFTTTGQAESVYVLGQQSADNLLSALETTANNNLTGVS